MRSYFVYILRCSDGSYYTGVTSDLSSRFLEHQNGNFPKCYTHKRRPVRFVYGEELEYIWEAIEREKQIKKWSRKKKEALIAGDIDNLEELAKSKATPRQARGDKMETGSAE